MPRWVEGLSNAAFIVEYGYGINSTVVVENNVSSSLAQRPNRPPSDIPGIPVEMISSLPLHKGGK